jgi:hypothetical protein
MAKKKYKPISIEEVWEKGSSIPFMRDYEYHTLFAKKKVPQGKKAIITRPYRNLLGEITHVNVRLADGERVKLVPIDYLVI